MSTHLLYRVRILHYTFLWLQFRAASSPWDLSLSGKMTEIIRVNAPKICKISIRKRQRILSDVVSYIPGLGGREFTFPLGRVLSPQPILPSLSPPARRGEGSAARPVTAGPPLRCQGFAEARLTGRSGFPGPHERGDAEASPGASPNGLPQTAPQLADIQCRTAPPYTAPLGAVT